MAFNAKIVEGGRSTMGTRILVGPIPRELRTLAYVPRWGIIRTQRTQSVAEHSFNVALYASLIFHTIKFSMDTWDAHDVPSEGHLLRAALVHDLEEVITGDIPSPVHRAVKHYGAYGGKVDKWLGERFQFEELSPEKSQIVDWVVKAADYLDALFFLHDELHAGNQHCAEIYKEMRVWSMQFFDTIRQHPWVKNPDAVLLWLHSQISENVSRLDRVVA